MINKSCCKLAEFLEVVYEVFVETQSQCLDDNTDMDVPII